LEEFPVSPESKKPEMRCFHIPEDDPLDEAQLAARVRQADELPGAEWF
jgi:hypothetical protein